VAALWSTRTSWLDVKRKPRNGYNGSAQWVPIEKTSLIPVECVCKSDQWICLTRQHAELVTTLPSLVDHNDMWQAYRKCCASDEMYFATMLACTGVLPSRRESISTFNEDVQAQGQVSLRKMTFVEWIYPDLDDYSGSSSLADRPVIFDGLTEELVTRAIAEGCIFARKFRGCSADEWEQLVYSTADRKVEGTKEK